MKMNTGIFSRLPANTALKNEFSEQELQETVNKYNQLRTVDRFKAIDFLSKTGKGKGFNTEQNADLLSVIESEWETFSETKNEKDKAENDSLINELSKKVKIALSALAASKQKKIDANYGGDINAYFNKVIPSFLSQVTGVKYEDGKFGGELGQIEKLIKIINQETPSQSNPAGTDKGNAMNNLDFLELIGAKQMTHPKTGAIHWVKDNKSLSFQDSGVKGKKSIDEITNEAVQLIVRRIRSGSEKIPEGVTDADLDKLSDGKMYLR